LIGFIYTWYKIWNLTVAELDRMMHVGLGRTHPLHVEYIHIGASLSMIQDILTEAILSHPRLHLSRKIAIVKALGKVIWIQNDLFAKWYVHDGEEFTAGVDYSALIDREGFLRGKKVLNHDRTSDDGESSSGDTPKAAKPGDGVCPFTGAGAAVEKAMWDLKINPRSNGEGVSKSDEGVAAAAT
jgi:hypothetical protein